MRKLCVFFSIFFTLAVFAKENECSVSSELPVQVSFSSFVSQAKAPRLKTETFVHLAWIDHTGDATEQAMAGYLLSIYHSPTDDTYQLLIEKSPGDVATFVFSPTWTREEFELTAFEREDIKSDDVNEQSGPTANASKAVTLVTPDPVFEASFKFLDASAQTGYLKWKAFVERHGIGAAQKYPGFEDHWVREHDRVGASAPLNPNLRAARANIPFRIVYIQAVDNSGVVVVGVVHHQFGKNLNGGRDLTRSYQEWMRDIQASLQN